MNIKLIRTITTVAMLLGAAGAAKADLYQIQYHAVLDDVTCYTPAFTRVACDQSVLSKFGTQQLNVGDTVTGEYHVETTLAPTNIDPNSTGYTAPSYASLGTSFKIDGKTYGQTSNDSSFGYAEIDTSGRYASLTSFRDASDLGAGGAWAGVSLSPNTGVAFSGLSDIAKIQMSEVAYGSFNAYWAPQGADQAISMWGHLISLTGLSDINGAPSGTAPEPEQLALFAIGILGAAAAMRRRKS